MITRVSEIFCGIFRRHSVQEDFLLLQRKVEVGSSPVVDPFVKPIDKELNREP